MEYRNFGETPREHLDESLLRQILQEEAAGTPGYGCRQNTTSPRTGGCGCGAGSPGATGTSRSRQSGAGNNTSTCGCSRSHGNGNCSGTPRGGGCGCSRNQAQPAQESGCTCTCQDTCTASGNIPPLGGFPLSMVYSPHQEWSGLYEPEEALAQGTLFSALTFPWYPSACPERCGKTCGNGGGNT